MKVKISNVLTKLYGINVFCYAMLQTAIPGKYYTINLALRYLFVIIMSFSLILKLKDIKKVNIRNSIIISILCILIIYSTIVNKTESSIILIVGYMFILSDCKKEDILRCYTYGIFCTIFITIIAWKVGLVDDINSRGRLFIGFNFSTFGANLFLHGCLAFVAYKKENIKLFEWIIIEIINIYIYVKTNTLAVFALMILLFVAYYILKNEKVKSFITKNDTISFIISHLGILLAIFTILLQINYNMHSTQKFWKRLNTFTSGRLSYGKVAFETLDIKLLGQKLNWVMSSGKDYFYLDSSYLNILFNNGIILLIVICYLMDIMEKNALRNKDFFFVLGISFILMHAITDPQLLSFRYNPFYMTLMPILLKEYKERKERKNEETDSYHFKENRII